MFCFQLGCLPFPPALSTIAKGARPPKTKHPRICSSMHKPSGVHFSSSAFSAATSSKNTRNCLVACFALLGSLCLDLLGLACLCLALLGFAWLCLARFGLACLACFSWLCLALLGFAWLGLTWLAWLALVGFAWLGLLGFA